MGEVFVARTPWDENPLAAVKRLRPDVARVPTFAERFAHEAELAVRLGHTNVVGTLDVGSVEGQLYVASQLVLGKDTGLIADRLRERGQGGPAAVGIRLLLDTLAGLAYVHGAREPNGEPLRLVHRDVTPGNVLVGYDGASRLADFGLAKSLLTERSHLTNHGEILGTPHYLAPEVIRGDQASPVSDLYGVGAVMYRFLTGVAPHQGTTAEVLLKVLSEEPRPLSDLRPDLPPWLVVFVHRLLEKDPARRPMDASVLHKQLIDDAKAAGLLVPKTAVGRWLGSLFEEEKREELEEYEQVAAMHPDDVPEEPEGTVVLARPRAGLKLEAPPSIEQEFQDSQGTELELSEAVIRSFTTEGRASDVTQAALAIQDPELDDDPEAVLTKAVTVFKTALDDEGTPSSPDVLDTDTHDGDSEEATKFGSFVASGSGARPSLPGFVDGGGSTDGDADTSPPPRRRPKNPGSVIVSPAPVAAKPKPAEVRSDPPVRARATPIAQDRPHARAQTPGRARPSRPKSPPQRAAPPRRRSSSASMTRNLLLLTGLLCIAVALGIGIGVLVASLKQAPHPAPAVRLSLEPRITHLEKEIEGRSNRGEAVPEEAWKLIANARAALMEGNETAATQRIDEAERLVSAAANTAQR